MNYLYVFWRKWWPSIITFVLAIVMTGVYYFDHIRCWLASELKSGFETSRNIALILAALIGLLLAFWRSRVADKQSKISESGLRNEQFQRGAEMLGGKEAAIRLGGIYALGRLAQDHPEDYFDPVIKTLAAFVRRPAHDEETTKPEKFGTTKNLRFREDVWEAVRTICELNDNKVVKHDQPNIARSDLSEMRFPEKNFSGMIMLNTNLTDCDLTGAKLNGVDLTGATLTNTNISDAVFTGVKGLSQEQLDKACQSPDKPPPKNLPPSLTWDKKAAMARWEKCMAEKAESIMP